MCPVLAPESLTSQNNHFCYLSKEWKKLPFLFRITWKAEANLRGSTNHITLELWGLDAALFWMIMNTIVAAVIFHCHSDLHTYAYPYTTIFNDWGHWILRGGCKEHDSIQPRNSSKSFHVT